MDNQKNDNVNVQLQLVKNHNFISKLFSKIKGFFARKKYATIEINELKNELKEEANRVEDNRASNNEYVINKLDNNQVEEIITNSSNDEILAKLITDIRNKEIELENLTHEQLDVLNNHYEKENYDLSTEIKINKRKLRKINVKLDNYKEEIHKLRDELIEIKTA